MIGTTIHLIFAGIWSQVWHWGFGIGLIVLCLFAAYGTRLIAGIPVIGLPLSLFLAPLRKDLLYAAAIIAVFLAGQWLGAHDEAKKAEARKVVIEHKVDTVIQKTSTPKAKAKPDKWDRPEF